MRLPGKRTICLLLTVALLLALSGGAVAAAPVLDGAPFSMFAGELTVRPENPTALIGGWVDFIVERGGETLSYMDLTYEIVEGADCAAVYYDGSLRGLGEGRVVVKAYLDEDPAVCGFGAVEVVAGGANHFTETDPGGMMGAYDPTFEAQLAAFPASYRKALLALHGNHPQWAFEPLYVGLDFWESVAVEASGDRNLTLKPNVSDTVKSYLPGDYDRASGEFINKDTGWVATNEIPVAYFMDPRNFLDERGIFQFESLRYDAGFHTLAGVEGILAGTFMSEARMDYLDAQGNAVAADATYGEAILSAAAETGVNPYYLAAKIRGEIGATPSRSVTGECAGYEGLYNFYNIGATDGEGNIERALAWASSGETYNRPWTSPAASILGGAMYIAENYVAGGQDSGYLQKWNVAPYTTSTLYLHQYMTNVSGALSQAVSAYAGYAEIGMLDSPILFSIPVYDNMPGETESAGELSAGSAQYAVVNEAVYVRTAPHAANSQEGTRLAPGTVVKILRGVGTDASYYYNWLFYPFWYEIAFEVGGETRTGYVCESFVTVGANGVLRVGETMRAQAARASEISDDTVRWVSENTAVATVTDDGLVTAIAPGCTTLVGWTASGAFCEIGVLVA